jgi:cytidylate kinase
VTLRVVAIDGPAGTGKSTTARRVASVLGWPYVDSGAFYRAAALMALRAGLDLELSEDRDILRRALADSRIEQEMEKGGLRTSVDGEDVSDAIRSSAVTAIVPRVADDPGLRDVVNKALRARVGEGPAIVDGRDIGTIVFPEAFLKLYLDASIGIRAQRRAREVEPAERAADDAVLASYAESIAERDRADRARPRGALTAAPDAVHIDTSALDLDTQIARVLRLIQARIQHADT